MEASRRGPRHASRPFPFLPLSSPAPPPGKVSYGKLREPAARLPACHGCHGKSVSWKTASPGLAAVVAIWPPLPFRAAPDKGRGQMIHERICNVKLNLQFFWIFFAESLGTRMGSGIAGVDFFLRVRGKLGGPSPLDPASGSSYAVAPRLRNSGATARVLTCGAGRR